MLNTILDYEEIKEVLEEESKKHKSGLKKLALIHKGTILQLFDVNECIEIIEHSAIEIVENTLQSNNIDLCYVIIDKNYNIVYKNIIQNDIIREELENYQKINEHIYVLGDKELKAELLNYSENIFLNILKCDGADSNTYFEIIDDVTTYDICVEWIFEEVRTTYERGYTIFTTNNSFILHGSYLDATITDFKDDYYIFNKDTKLFLIDEIENSNLSEATKKGIIENIKNY